MSSIVLQYVIHVHNLYVHICVYGVSNEKGNMGRVRVHTFHMYMCKYICND